MKIKEVIKKTELTDKAIRLYIDNGLVAPSIDESYSGRKSIDFSDDDVERLSNIALLRKAGFSILYSFLQDKKTASPFYGKPFSDVRKINFLRFHLICIGNHCLCGNLKGLRLCGCSLCKGCISICNCIEIVCLALKNGLLLGEELSVNFYNNKAYRTDSEQDAQDL